MTTSWSVPVREDVTRMSGRGEQGGGTGSLSLIVPSAVPTAIVAPMGLLRRTDKVSTPS